ncbi:MAG TPA: hypothetical protein VM509_03915 [Planctomycetota bacterium]|nr:hypothetical protein [Planctomycetota bacterium]
MAKVAGFVVAQLVSLALGLGVAYAMSMCSGPPSALGGINWGWPPVWIALALILLFVTPALGRHFSRFLEEARGKRGSAVAKLVASFVLSMVLAVLVGGGVYLATMKVSSGRPRVHFIITSPPPWSWLVWVIGGVTFLLGMQIFRCRVEGLVPDDTDGARQEK